jgi:hypothetical protein
MQKGSPFDWPDARKPTDRYFRLIDFGRSKQMFEDCKTTPSQKYFDRMEFGGLDRIREEGEILNMFKLHHYATS